MRCAASLALVLTAGLSGLTACSPAHPAAEDVHVTNRSARHAQHAAAPLPRSLPTGLRIPSAGVDASSMLRLGLGPDRGLEVPPADKGQEPGWWTGSVTPGQRGAAVIVAHYDTANGPALLRDVALVRVGDEIAVPRADGRTATFTVQEIQQVAKDRFPTRKVYGPTSTPQLRLITCGGPIVDGHRADNIILYAALTS
ncbi:sortase (surface protein transpeptidase) [Streptomyces sp. PsTaAH-137]|nr:class F sortase [Streptomyces sp. SID8367]MYT73448.1 class F sortase [Streptomyces sp. SID8367]RAJ84977.1 sortase (surface protein transpeptidase) [Streptomyces sp. PsTaAH-137]